MHDSPLQVSYIVILKMCPDDLVTSKASLYLHLAATANYKEHVQYCIETLS